MHLIKTQIIGVPFFVQEALKMIIAAYSFSVYFELSEEP